MVSTEEEVLAPDDRDLDEMDVTDNGEDTHDKYHDDRIELLEYERNLMLDTFSDDVLFIIAKGLGIERLILHHLYLYSDPKLLVFVINSSSYDECYFLECLKEISKDCQPRMINSDVSIRDREALYMEGGVHFITSRILMVDLLQDRVPVKNIAGIIVLRAHQLLNGFQESFILRLYRERKADGFVKAFSDNPSIFGSLGDLQRLVSRLYIRRVRLVPRFDADVKRILDLNCPKMVEMVSDLPHSMRKVQSALVDIIRTCVNELKICSSSINVVNDEEASDMSVGLNYSALELQLKNHPFSLSEKQQRLLNDLKQLRTLLYQAEEMDMATLYRNLVSIRHDKDLLTNNSGWLFTQTASKLYIEVENMCKLKVDDEFVLFECPKWSALKSVLEEVAQQCRSLDLSDSPVLLIGGGSEVCYLIRDLVKFGVPKFKWVRRQQINDQSCSERNKSFEPVNAPLWNSNYVSLFDSNFEGEVKASLVNDFISNQKAVARNSRKRRKRFEEEVMKRKVKREEQTRLVQFGIVHYKREINTTDIENEQTTSNQVPETKLSNLNEPELSCSDPLLFILSHYERYNVLKKLKALSPHFVILYHTDLVILRLLEMYKACNPNHELIVYILMYRESNEEERYLYSLRNEQLAFERLVREQGSLFVPSEYETARETTHKLNLVRSTRDAGGSSIELSENPKIVIDLREFNSELPTILYKRGIDLIPATLEVGDYILSPNVAVERKALDDLVHSLHCGRVFKQIEQMLRHYKNVILLIESNSKDNYRKATGGPFQGELSRKCRETRELFTILVRSYPQMHVVWSSDPNHSAEMFEDFKSNEPNPDADKAVALRSGIDIIDDEDSKEDDANNKEEKVKQFNKALQRQLARLPLVNSSDVVRMMCSDKANCLLDFINSNVEKLSAVVGDAHATSLHTFFSTNFRDKDVLDHSHRV